MIFLGMLAIIVIVGIKVGTAYALGDIHIHLPPWPKCWPSDPDCEDNSGGGGDGGDNGGG